MKYLGNRPKSNITNCTGPYIRIILGLLCTTCKDYCVHLNKITTINNLNYLEETNIKMLRTVQARSNHYFWGHCVHMYCIIAINRLRYSEGRHKSNTRPHRVLFLGLLCTHIKVTVFKCTALLHTQEGQTSTNGFHGDGFQRRNLVLRRDLHAASGVPSQILAGIHP